MNGRGDIGGVKGAMIAVSLVAVIVVYLYESGLIGELFGELFTR